MKKIAVIIVLLVNLTAIGQTFTKANYGVTQTKLDKEASCITVITSFVDSSVINIACIYVPTGMIVYNMNIRIIEDVGIVSSDSVYVNAYLCDVTIKNNNSNSFTKSDILVILKYSDVSKRLDIIVHTTNNKALYKFNYSPKFI